VEAPASDPPPDDINRASPTTSEKEEWRSRVCDIVTSFDGELYGIDLATPAAS
jgi:hypothetical protein